MGKGRRAGVWCSVVLALLCGGWEVQGMPLVHAEADVRLDVPDHWSVERDRGIVVAQAMDDSAAVVLSILEAKQREDAFAVLDREMEEIVEGFEFVASRGVKREGMKGREIEGRGLVDGVPLVFIGSLWELSSGRFLMVLGFSEASMKARALPRLRSVFQSVRSL